MVTIPDHLIPILDEMYYEMSEQFLETCLVPAERGGEYRMIRVSCNQNPKWYKELCERYPCTRSKRRTKRKDHTKIKRQYIFKIFEWMIKNKKSKSKYAEDILQEAKDRYEVYKKLENDSKNIPWDNQF